MKLMIEGQGLVAGNIAKARQNSFAWERLLKVQPRLHVENFISQIKQQLHDDKETKTYQINYKGRK